MTQIKLSEYTSPSDSISLTNIDGKSFTVTGIEDSNYTDGEKTTPGVKITTKEEFDINGEKHNKFHTTRQVVVDALSNEKLRADIESGGELGPVVCRKPDKKNYFIMEDAT